MTRLQFLQYLCFGLGLPSVVLMRTPAMLFAGSSVMAFNFSAVGGLTIMSRGRSYMLALTIFQISKERDKGAISELRI